MDKTMALELQASIYRRGIDDLRQQLHAMTEARDCLLRALNESHAIIVEVRAEVAREASRADAAEVRLDQCEAALAGYVEE